MTIDIADQIEELTESLAKIAVALRTRDLNDELPVGTVRELLVSRMRQAGDRLADLAMDVERYR